MKKSAEWITSRQNALLKLTASLSDRKFRERECLFRFDGKKLLCEALAAALPLFAVLLRESNADGILQLTQAYALPQDCRLAILPDELFDRLSEEKAPDGVICVSHHLQNVCRVRASDPRICAGGRSLLLESVRDPGNLGTIIRSAAAFGTARVILSADCADPYHPRTLRAAMGTLFHTEVLVVEELCAAIGLLAGQGRVYAAALDASAVKLGQTAFDANDAVVIGNEGHGLSAAVLSACTDKIYIPMAPGVESLNAGVAASVLLWELYREGLS